MTVNILQTKLASIDAECEKDVSSEISKLLSEARYNGSKFNVPSFQDAGILWIEMIKRKERECIAGISRVFDAAGTTMGKKEFAALRCEIDEIFSEERYLERMSRFSASVARSATRYGITFDASNHSTDSATYQVAAMNALRNAKANITAEVELLRKSNAPHLVKHLRSWWSYASSNLVGALCLVLVAFGTWLVSKMGIADIWRAFEAGASFLR